jgi:hypothetical protein
MRAGTECFLQGLPAEFRPAGPGSELPALADVASSLKQLGRSAMSDLLRRLASAARACGRSIRTGAYFLVRSYCSTFSAEFPTARTASASFSLFPVQ